MAGHYLAYLNLNDASDELYNSIINGNFSYAIKLSRCLSAKNGIIINDVVQKLTQAVNAKLLSYGYKLWTSGEKDIVKQYFPKSYYHIFNEDDVLLVNKQYNQAIKLALRQNSDGDRVPWGDPNDKTSNRVVWKVIPIWENNKVHFILKNLDQDQFLKMGIFPDKINDRPVFGSDYHDTMRHTWYLEPLYYRDNFVFLIRSRQFSQVLKLAVSADDIGDRRLWGHNGEIAENDIGRFAFTIVRQPISRRGSVPASPPGASGSIPE